MEQYEVSLLAGEDKVLDIMMLDLSVYNSMQ